MDFFFVVCKLLCLYLVGLQFSDGREVPYSNVASIANHGDVLLQCRRWRDEVW